ncbi:hypothetical protein FRC04_004612 [Tulasnella sp. 424]|nr:hypothetical protein FRC04_004612 [Tulasnella sp. 424]KAG8972061.1 hypothetical protein FRC05_010353 [Tulasnella sp. 425]
MASSEHTEWLSFGGAPEEKAATFIQNLNRQAFAKGKSKDDEWLAQYAAACLSDDALAWYYSLAEEVQNSWRKMCPALLKEFSNKPAAAAKIAEVEVPESDIMPAPAPAPAPGWNSSLAPTPAAAPAPSPASPASRPPVPARSPFPAQQSSTTRIGYIELADAFSGNRLGYINSKGDKTITQDVNDALLLELPLAASPSTPVSLRMINSSINDPQRSYAGIMAMTSPLPWWMLVVCAPGNNAWHIPGLPPTVTMSNVWTAHPLGETLELKLFCPGRSHWEGPARLYVGQYLPIDTIAKDFISSNPKPRSEDMLCAYRKSDLGSLHGFRKVRMIFRPTQ